MVCVRIDVSKEGKRGREPERALKSRAMRLRMRANVCVCGVRLHSVGSALCTAEITSSRPFKPLLSVGVHANCPAVR